MTPDLATAGQLTGQLAATNGTKELVLLYLKQGPGGLVLEGTDMTRTDGEWAWDEELTNAVRNRDVRVPDGLFATMVDRSFMYFLEE